MNTLVNQLVKGLNLKYVTVVIPNGCGIVQYGVSITFLFQNEELLLSSNMPLLVVPSHDCKAVLMDTPGFFEAAKEITEVAQMSLEGSCVYLFVMKYDQLQDEADDAILKRLCSSDKSKMNLCTIVI